MNEEKPQLTVSTSEDIKKWKKKNAEGEIFELPSGLKVQLGRPKLTVLLEEGVIPRELMTLALSVSNGKEVSKPEDIDKAIRVMEILCQQAFINPKLVKDNPTEGQIAYRDLTDEDRQFVISYVRAGEAGLRRFRIRLENAE